jgi:hypothetical protein
MGRGAAFSFYLMQLLRCTSFSHQFVKQNVMQHTYKAMLRPFSLTYIAVRKQQVLHILSVFLDFGTQPVKLMRHTIF